MFSILNYFFLKNELDFINYIYIYISTKKSKEMTLRQTGNSIGSLLQNRSSVTLAADQIDELKEKFLKVYFTFEYIYS